VQCPLWSPLRLSRVCVGRRQCCTAHFFLIPPISSTTEGGRFRCAATVTPSGGPSAHVAARASGRAASSGAACPASRTRARALRRRHYTQASTIYPYTQSLGAPPSKLLNKAHTETHSLCAALGFLKAPEASSWLVLMDGSIPSQLITLSDSEKIGWHCTDSVIERQRHCQLDPAATRQRFYSL
jgi:hypothetical protein